MNFVPVITHTVAILLGWLVVSFASISPPTDDAMVKTGSKEGVPVFRSARSELRTNPSSLLGAQANLPMDPRQRLQLKRRILTHWAANDPDGLLAYLHDRPWLSLSETHPDASDPTYGIGFTTAAHLAMETMAKRRPADLVAYAKQEGCDVAISTLFRHGDPRLMLDLVLDLPPEHFSIHVFGDILGELFARGCKLDPGFHHRLDTIEDPSIRRSAFGHVAETLLSGKRHEDLIALLKHLADTGPTEKLDHELALQIVRTKTDMAILQDLPESLRPGAIRETLDWLAMASGIHTPDEDHQRASLSTCIENDWLKGNMDAAHGVITLFFESSPIDEPGMAVIEATAWKDWALNLPTDPKWDSLRRTAIRRWALTSPGDLEAFAELPAEDLRNAAYTAVVHTINTEAGAEQLPWILEQITDPALRNLAAEVIAARIENDPETPIDIDPFRPLGVR